ncbi:hypothetical protein [Clostridium sp.]|uniref:hypothetical protein n=1 Tax=Clostridium sp. TaxID=1506 RepID=UPI003F35E9DD
MKRKVGRPTDLKKDSLIRVRVDSEALQSIDKVLEDVNQNRSEVMREMLPIISSRDFENMISISSLKRLELYSIECNNLIDRNDFSIKLDDVSEKYPAFVLESSTPILYIKYPTYKVRILSFDIKQDILTSILKDIDGISEVYETQCSLFDSLKPNSFNTNYLCEVLCLRDNLEENETTKDYICTKLKSKDIKYEVWPAYYLKAKPVKIKSENDQKYVTNFNL